jgi:cyclopropane fatty-acyl-phospholipid synthase-like methyltransferase
MSFSNFLETEILDHVFGGAAYTAPGTHYLALYTAAPGETGGGTEVSTSGTAYVRKAVAFTTSGNTTSNTAAVEFPTATASFGTVTHVGVFDALTSGNLMAYATLSSSKTIDTGDVFRVPTGDLDITLD